MIALFLPGLVTFTTVLIDECNAHARVCFSCQQQALRNAFRKC